MAVTKSVAAVDEWAEVAQNAVREGTTVDVSGCYGAALNINIAISSTTAHTGSRIIVQVSSNSSGDEDWHDLVPFLTSSGTANSEAITDNPLAAASTTIAVANTTGYDADGVIPIFIEDGTVANSEICWLVSHVANTSITVQDGTTNEHAQNTLMYNIVDTYIVELPFDANRVRIIYDNTHDPDGATIHTYSRITKVTGI